MTPVQSMGWQRCSTAVRNTCCARASKDSQQPPSYFLLQLEVCVPFKYEVRDFTETIATNYKHEDSGIFREQPGKTKATFVLFNLKSCYFSQFQEN